MQYTPVTMADVPDVYRFLASKLTLDSNFSATYMLGWQALYGARFHRTPRYWLYAVDYEGETYNYAPLAATREDFLAGIEALEEAGITKIVGLNDWQAELLNARGYETYADRDLAEYIYETEALITLKGKKYHSKRNFINGFQYPYTFRPYTDADYDTVMELLHVWQGRHGDFVPFDPANLPEGAEPTEVEAEEYAIQQALTHREAFHIVANVLEVEGKIVGFAAGEIMPNGMAVIFFEKGDITYKGIYPMLDNLFIKENFASVPFVNKQEDMGLEGLRHSKMSYCPVRLLERITAVKPC